MNTNYYKNLHVKLRTGKKDLLAILLILLLAAQLNSQVSKRTVIMINAAAQSDGITLNWKARTFSGNYSLYRRGALDYKGWGVALTTLPSTATSYKDATAIPGKSFEYKLVQSYNGGNPLPQGYIFAGNTLKETLYKGGIILLIDSNYMKQLAS